MENAFYIYHPNKLNRHDRNSLHRITISGSATACVYVCHSTGTGATHTSNTDHTPVLPISVDRKTTSIYRRAHTSAYDERLSAKIMGLTGAIVIALVVLAVISIDAIRIVVKFTSE